MDEEEEEERGEHEDELELVHGVFEDGLVVQVPCERQYKEDNHEEKNRHVGLGEKGSLGTMNRSMVISPCISSSS